MLYRRIAAYLSFGPEGAVTDSFPLRGVWGPKLLGFRVLGFRVLRTQDMGFRDLGHRALLLQFRVSAL